MMRQTAAKVLKGIYDAWRVQDLDTVAGYLPSDFTHAVHIPTRVLHLGGLRAGKQSTLERLRLVIVEFDFLAFDARDVMFDKDHAAVEIPIRYRHRATGVPLEAVFANFWTFEGDRPVRLSEYHDVARIQAFSDTVAAVEASRPAVV
jgi:ketosteroid isomerase-like protein